MMRFYFGTERKALADYYLQQQKSESPIKNDLGEQVNKTANIIHVENTVNVDSTCVIDTINNNIFQQTR